MEYEIRELILDDNEFRSLKINDHKYAIYRIGVKVENNKGMVYLSKNTKIKRGFNFRGKIYLNNERNLIVHGTSGWLNIEDRKKLGNKLVEKLKARCIHILDNVLFENVRD